MRVKMGSFSPKDMKSARVLSVVGLLGLSVLPADSVVAQDLRLTGIVRDFNADNTPGGHQDFGIIPAHGFDHYAGNVERLLGADGNPDLAASSGRQIISEATDTGGHTIAPHLANKVLTRPVNDFEIGPGGVVPGEDYAVALTVLGAAISWAGLYDMPVTVEVNVDTTTIAPWGDFDLAVSGNINDGSAPLYFVAPEIYGANTQVSVKGQSWKKIDPNSPANGNAAYQTYLTVDSDSTSPLVLTLRNGDLVPNIPGFLDQEAIVWFVRDYVDTTTNRAVLDDNQAIYLFEIGTTNLTHPAADFQDLVVLVSLANIQEFFTEGPGVWVDAPLGDSSANEGAVDSGGLSTPANFDEWYKDVPGVNISTILPLTLVEQPDGTYVFDDADDPFYSDRGGFFPIDDELFGNSGCSPDHNHHFTFELHTVFTYDASASQMFQFTGNDDVWVFIDGHLVIDLGGVHGPIDQYIDVDRLELQDGEVYSLDFFSAERYCADSIFRITTNLHLEAFGFPTTTAAYD